jgi:solute:Na+ symporter, SSS family
MELLVYTGDRGPDPAHHLFYPFHQKVLMSGIDWIVLIITLVGIIAYGLYKSRTTKNLDGYFLCNHSVPWYMVLLSIMGTQASAVTFLSAPGQAYTDGMRFVQIYFGLPLAMVVLSITFVPVFRRLRIYTAYEFLEQRFDLKTRTLTSFLFLLQRGVSTGISISAPAIILSSLLGWNILWTNVFMGGLLIIYTVSGGAKSVAYTQQLQLIIIIAGMFMAGYIVVHLLPAKVSFLDALHVSGKAGKLNVISTGMGEHGFNWKDTYNIWSGVIGGFFLSLSYFGTDQVQVGRYLTARTTGESKLGLLLNGLVKIPMQFLILMLGALVFAFYQFHPEPVFFNKTQVELLSKSKYKDSLLLLKNKYDAAQSAKIVAMNRLNDGTLKEGSVAWNESQLQLKTAEAINVNSRATIKNWLKDKSVNGNNSDTNYIFLRFVVDYLPKGLVGLLIAVIFLAAWGSNSAALNSLASATMVDFHKRYSAKPIAERKEYDLSRWYTLAWGIFCIIVAQLAYNIGSSLIEAVNVLGSLFYGVVLGIFLVAFYAKKVGARAVFVSALIIESMVITIHILNQNGIIGLSYLWLNLIGALGVLFLAWAINPFFRSRLQA